MNTYLICGTHPSAGAGGVGSSTDLVCPWLPQLPPEQQVPPQLKALAKVDPSAAIDWKPYIAANECTVLVEEHHSLSRVQTVDWLPFEALQCA